MSVLDEIVRARRASVGLDKAREAHVAATSRPRAGERAALFLEKLDAAARADLVDPSHQVRERPVIAEVKRRSPSRGDLRPDLDPVQLALAYERAGAWAISVLTEPDYFGGSFADLAAVSRAVRVPVLCKDFVVDPHQIRQAGAAGGDLVLLMVAVLGPETGHFVRLARRAGLEPLVEAHTGAELEMALAAGARLVGVNNRDLNTLNVDLGVCRSLLPRIPAGILAVAESGLKSAADLDDLGRHGAAAYLVGETLVTASDPEAALRRLVRRQGAIYVGRPTASPHPPIVSGSQA